MQFQRIMNTLRYLWKARNDLRFQRKKWTVLQVNHAVEADIKVTNIEAESNKLQVKLPSAGTRLGAVNHQPIPQARCANLAPPIHSSICRLPSLIQGPRCYSDAAIAPDTVTNIARPAGLGIFLLDPVQKLKCFIKVRVEHVTSVLMAEAAGMAIAAVITSQLGFQTMSFFTDSQALAGFYNGQDLHTPPQWNIKPFTHRFLSAMTNLRWRVLKIHRDLNITAHVLASQAFRDFSDITSSVAIICNNGNHLDSCPLREALRDVNWEWFSLIAAVCC
jgi:ribonuclease HI